jgi:1-acyl-sn-glycerol-3-phosphate acyltransferase
MRNLLLHFRSGISLSMMLINTVFWCTPLFIIAIFKFLIPIKIWRQFCSRILVFLAESFIDVNNWVLKYISRARFNIKINGDLNPKGSYLVISNHQSYADIIILQRVLNHKIPFLKFFLKQQLIWIPVFGLAWWALDFPFMKRHSREYLKKHPQQAGADFRATQKACEKFKDTPVSIMNFAEGTRFTAEKKQRQNSPFDNLLKPKAGGIGYVISLMGEQIKRLVNVTIIYPEKDINLWNFLGGRYKDIIVQIEAMDLPSETTGDYINSPKSRVSLQRWLNQIWVAKDREINSRIGNSEKP